VSSALLLDEMLSHTIARQLRSRGHDVVAVVEDPSLMGLPDEEILAAAAAEGRAFVTANVKDFTPLDHRYKASGRAHAGIVFVSTKAFPQDRAFIGALVSALDKFLDEDRSLTDAVVFLPR
jgi:NADPH-dependent 2,4-dienoyl-CoA reductase/sulfur reductase-like enzyme